MDLSLNKGLVVVGMFLATTLLWVVIWWLRITFTTSQNASFEKIGESVVTEHYVSDVRLILGIGSIIVWFLFSLTSMSYFLIWLNSQLLILGSILITSSFRGILLTQGREPIFSHEQQREITLTYTKSEDISAWSGTKKSLMFIIVIATYLLSTGMQLLR